VQEPLYPDYEHFALREPRNGGTLALDQKQVSHIRNKQAKPSLPLKKLIRTSGLHCKFNFQQTTRPGAQVGEQATSVYNPLRYARAR
jgi:hypothetical protein